MWVFSSPYAYIGLFTFPRRWNIASSVKINFVSETDSRLIKRIGHRVGRGIPSSSGHIGAGLKILPPAVHSLLIRARMSWTFCDKQEPVTLDFFKPLLDAVSSSADPFRTLFENFAAPPHYSSKHKVFSTPYSLGSRQCILKSFSAFNWFCEMCREIMNNLVLNWNRSVTCNKLVPRSKKIFSVHNPTICKQVAEANIRERKNEDVTGHWRNCITKIKI